MSYLRHISSTAAGEYRACEGVKGALGNVGARGVRAPGRHERVVGPERKVIDHKIRTNT